MVEKLLPCPFCGTAEGLYPSHLWPGGGKPYAIDCCRCGIDFTPREGMDVIAAWNRRTPFASLVEENERLRKALEEAANQLAAAHDDAFKQAAGYGLVTSDGRDFSCFQLNLCEVASKKARAALRREGA